MNFRAYSFFLALLVIASSLVASPTPASAHILLINNDMGIVLHVDADDDPYVGSNSVAYFTLKDKTGKFVPQNCDCTVTIKQGDKTLLSKPFGKTLDTSLMFVDGDTLVVPFVFPERAIYTLAIEGSPNTAGNQSLDKTAAFRPFSISFDLRVARTDGPAATNTGSASTTSQNFFAKHFVHYVIFIPLILVIGGIIGYDYFTKRRMKSSVK